MCQNVTLTSLSIVLSMEKYDNKFVIGVCKMIQPLDLNMMYNNVIDNDDFFLITKVYFKFIESVSSKSKHKVLQYKVNVKSVTQSDCGYKFKHFL